MQYSCLENPTDRGGWWAAVHGVAKSQTRLRAHTHTRVHTENQFLSKSLWLINVEGMTELENYHFPSPSGMTDAGRSSMDVYNH